MHMKNIKTLLVGGALLTLLSGCKDKMVELNTDPGIISSALPEQLFTSATGSWDYESRGSLTEKYSGVMQIMQYIVSYSNTTKGSPYANQNSLDQPQPGTYGLMYTQFYNNHGRQLRTIVDVIDNSLDAGVRPDYREIRAISQILYTYDAWRLFDVYGAIPFEEAFMNTSGVMTPKYSFIDKMYKALDDTLKTQINVLAAKYPNQKALGTNDYFYGWSATGSEGGGSVFKPTAADVQRKGWLKFANAFRLQMAWRFKARDPEHFNQVLTEVMAVPDGLMNNNAESCIYSYARNYDDNPDDVDAISKSYGMSAAFVNYLKANSDPRLPLLARPNQVDTVNAKYKYMYKYFPDSLAKYGDILTLENIYQGQNANPAMETVEFTPGSKLVPGQALQFVIKNPNGEGHPWVNADGDTLIYIQKDTTISLNVVSPVQGRYFVKNGGKQGKNGDDGPAWIDYSKITLRRNILTYPEQCFMMAYLTLDGANTGKAASDWYEAGIRAAMESLNDDALRVYIQIATNVSYHNYPNVNPDGLYGITTAMIDDYIAAHPLPAGEDGKQAVMSQMWVHLYQNPESMWGYWKVTGYPSVITVTGLEPSLPATGYMEQPYASAGGKMAWPRRCKVPQPNTLNNDNYNAAKAQLESDPIFGNYAQTTGRIWWDINNQ